MRDASQMPQELLIYSLIVGLCFAPTYGDAIALMLSIHDCIQLKKSVYINAVSDFEPLRY
jgi:hypothetical protein